MKPQSIRHSLCGLCQACSVLYGTDHDMHACSISHSVANVMCTCTLCSDGAITLAVLLLLLPRPALQMLCLPQLVCGLHRWSLTPRCLLPPLWPSWPLQTLPLLHSWHTSCWPTTDHDCRQVRKTYRLSSAWLGPCIEVHLCCTTRMWCTRSIHAPSQCVVYTVSHFIGQSIAQGLPSIVLLGLTSVTFDQSSPSFSSSSSSSSPPPPPPSPSAAAITHMLCLWSCVLYAGAQGSAAALLCLCLLHHDLEVRRVAVSAGRALTSSQPDLLGPLLAGLRHWANRPTEALLLVVSESKCSASWPSSGICMSCTDGQGVVSRRDAAVQWISWCTCSSCFSCCVSLPANRVRLAWPLLCIDCSACKLAVHRLWMRMQRCCTVISVGWLLFASSNSIGSVISLL